MRTILQ